MSNEPMMPLIVGKYISSISAILDEPWACQGKEYMGWWHKSIDDPTGQAARLDWSNPEKIILALNDDLDYNVWLTLYGYGRSMDLIVAD